MARNELALWMAKKRSLAPNEATPKIDMEDATFLPATIDNARECKMCYANDSCMLYRKVSPGPLKINRKPRLTVIDCRSGPGQRG